MTSQPVVVEHLFEVPVAKVWDALTKNEQMKKWYFQLEDFKPVPGFEFQFTAGGKEGKEFVHLCKVTEVVSGKKLAYSWRYDGYPGNSIVSFELFEEGKKTKLRVTHTGLETFAASGPDFAKENFAMGWESIVNKSLRDFLENKSIAIPT
ncbi:MAG TPA: SRPBCC domain-containing protein [Puia sp.]|jgi:uncharacterized protein YndB with AHSA1/START domain